MKISQSFAFLEEDILDIESEDTYNLQDTLDNAIFTYQMFVEQNRIVSGDFEENVWKMEKSFSTGYINLRFLDVIDRNVLLMVKCWILGLAPKLENNTVKDKIFLVQSFLEKTETLNEKYLDNLEDIINGFAESLKYKAINATMNFLDYSSAENSELFYNELESISKKFDRFTKIRTLPPYKDILLFSHYLNYYWKIWSAEEQFKFFPILLWWKITSVIPLRIGEFLSLSRNCLVHGKFKIKLPRSKNEGHEALQVIDEIEINEELYSLISSYIELTNNYGESHTLLSYPAYRKSKNHKDVFAKTINPKRFNKDSFNTLLKEFYQELSIREKVTIIEKERYKEKLKEDNVFTLNPNEMVMMNPNDTRHHSICTLMLQGFNRLTIARLAGHKTVEAQFHYQKHLDSYAQSKVYELTVLNSFNEDVTFGDNTYQLLIDIRNRSLRNPDDFDFCKKVELGYCTDENMECESDNCVYCTKNWIPEKEIDENIDYLESIGNEMLSKIKQRTFVLERLFNEMEFTRNGNYSPEINEEFKREALTINSLIEDLSKLKLKIQPGRT